MLRNAIRSTIDVVKKVWQLDLRPPAEQLLFNFANKDEVHRWESSSDKKYGGLSTCRFQATENGAIFEGELSLNFDPDRMAFIKKSGFAGARSRKGHGVFDLHPFDTIELRLKGDGRTYITSLRTENWVDNMSSSDVDENTWQAFIQTTDNEWRVYRVPFKEYRKTFEGRFIAVDCKLNPRRILGIGIHAVARTHLGKLQAQGTGPFKLEVEWIKGARTGVGYETI